MLVLASALAVELHIAVRGDQRVAANARAEARARWAARGGLAHATETLRARLARSAVTGAGVVLTDTFVIPPTELDLDGVKVRATLVDARSKLQLNLAGPDQLAALFAAAGVEPGRAASLAAAVARWRAEHLPPFEATPRDPGAEAIRPPAGAFAEVEELRKVPGFTNDVYARVSPYLTVASDGRINLNTAPVPVLRTLAGIDARGARTIVERRRRAPLGNAYEVGELLPRTSQRGAEERMAELTARAAFIPREVEVRVTATVPASPVVARTRAVTVMAGGTRAPLVGLVER